MNKILLNIIFLLAILLQGCMFVNEKNMISTSIPLINPESAYDFNISKFLKKINYTKLQKILNYLEYFRKCSLQGYLIKDKFKIVELENLLNEKLKTTYHHIDKSLSYFFKNFDEQPGLIVEFVKYLKELIYINKNFNKIFKKFPETCLVKWKKALKNYYLISFQELLMVEDYNFGKLNKKIEIMKTLSNLDDFIKDKNNINENLFQSLFEKTVILKSSYIKKKASMLVTSIHDCDFFKTKLIIDTLIYQKIKIDNFKIYILNTIRSLMNNIILPKDFFNESEYKQCMNLLDLNIKKINIAQKNLDKYLSFEQINILKDSKKIFFLKIKTFAEKLWMNMQVYFEINDYYRGEKGLQKYLDFKLLIHSYVSKEIIKEKRSIQKIKKKIFEKVLKLKKLDDIKETNVNLIFKNLSKVIEEGPITTKNYYLNIKNKIEKTIHSILEIEVAKIIHNFDQYESEKLTESVIQIESFIKNHLPNTFNNHLIKLYKYKVKKYYFKNTNENEMLNEILIDLENLKVKISEYMNKTS